MPSRFTDMSSPTRGSCTWSTACSFWRGFGSSWELSQLLLRLEPASGDLASLAITGGWLTGKVGYYCVDTDPYVTVSTDENIIVDIWKALDDSLWSSSVVLTIHAAVKLGTWPASFKAQPVYSTNPSPQTKVITDLLNPPACPTSAGTTVTIYDDGTFSLT